MLKLIVNISEGIMYKNIYMSLLCQFYNKVRPSKSQINIYFNKLSCNTCRYHVLRDTNV